MDGFRNIIKDYIFDKDYKKIPKQLHSDEVTMEFRERTIEQEADRLSNQVMEDLFLLLSNKDKIKYDDSHPVGGGW